MPALNGSAGVRGELLTQLGSDLKKIPCDNIVVGDRLRGLDEATVTAIYESIEQEGLKHPIGIKCTLNGHYELVYGAHRLAAWQRRFAEQPERWHEISCLVYPDEMSEDMATLLEITENMDVCELTPAQRKTFAGKRAKLREKLFSQEKQATQKKQPTQPTQRVGPSWSNLSKELESPMTGCQRWWKQFSKETGYDGTPPSKNPRTLTDQFIDWLADTTRREEEEAQEEEAGKSRKYDAIVAAITAYSGAYGPLTNPQWKALKEVSNAEG